MRIGALFWNSIHLINPRKCYGFAVLLHDCWDVGWSRRYPVRDVACILVNTTPIIFLNLNWAVTYFCCGAPIIECTDLYLEPTEKA
jgi:hypothetical protein